MKFHERQTDLFRSFNPAKRFAQFTYDELTFEKINGGDCYKDHIIKIDDTFYIYAGCKTWLTDKPEAKSTIALKRGQKVVAVKPQ